MNSLVEFYHELLEEWDYEKNTLKPSEVSYGSNKKAWWRCKKSHSWEARISNRSKGNSGCPYCSELKASIENSITLKYPELLEEWDYEKNSLKPEEVSYGSKKKAWWKCKKGHSWETKINLRTVRKTRCPKCNLRKLSNKNSFTVRYPELLEEWDYEKNTLKPEEVSYGSKRKMWWKCKKGHSWEARVNSRTNMETKCPYCAGQKVSHKNSLIELYPELLEEWDYEKNVIKPEEISYGSNKKVWWKCKNGHSWDTSPNSRTNKKTGCFYCSGKRKKD